jgi:hypothetical protein
MPTLTDPTMGAEVEAAGGKGVDPILDIFVDKL